MSEKLIQIIGFVGTSIIIEFFTLHLLISMWLSDKRNMFMGEIFLLFIISWFFLIGTIYFIFTLKSE